MKHILAACVWAMTVMVIAMALAQTPATEPPTGGDEPVDVAIPEQESQDADAMVEALAEGPQASVEENADIRASADDVFEPDDEIPEDYPVPLPSDI